MLNVEFLRLANESFGFGIEEAKNEENQMVYAGYMWQEAADAQEDDHLPKLQALEPVEPWRREAHEERYDDRYAQYREGRIVDEGEGYGAEP